MIVTCPSCSTRYMSDSSTFQPSGRAVRCAHCGHGWHQDPPEDYSLRALPHTSAGASQDEQRAVQSATNSRKVLKMGQMAGWACLVLCVVAISTVGYSFRTELVRLWPQSATLYSALGVPVNTRGVVFVQTDYDLDLRDGAPVLTISGNIQNPTETSKTLPAIQFSLRARDRSELYSWTIEPPVVELGANETESFQTYIDNPPVGAEDLVVTFIRPSS